METWEMDFLLQWQKLKRIKIKYEYTQETADN